jgi:hypothetical protein
MFGSAILETAIGLVLIYLLLSLICSSAREGIEAVMKSRASMLEQGIGELLRTSAIDGKRPSSTDGLVAALYNHPLIYSLYRGQYVPGAKHLPSYIPSRNFALALMDIVVRGPLGSNADVPRTAENVTSTLPGRTLTGDPRASTVSNAVTQAMAAAGAVAQASSSVATTRPTTPYLPPAASAVATQALTLAGLTEALGSSTDLTIHAKRALQIAIETAGNDFTQAQKNIEDWYNSAMDRVSGWYKHQSQKYLFLLGLGVTIVANVDTVVVGKALYLQPSVREALVAQASAIRNDSSYRTGQVAPNAVVSTLEQFDLPLGWSKAHYHPDWYRSASNVATYVVEPAIGWLLTALAIALGAPFWFDMLNRIMVVRSTVKPHEKSPEEASIAPRDDDK